MAARGRPFQAGQSGNPAGRAKGTRTHYSMLAEKLMGGDIEDITRSVIDAAKGGDMTAARIVLDRITPVRRDRPVVFESAAHRDDGGSAEGDQRPVAGGRLWRTHPL